MAKIVYKQMPAPRNLTDKSPQAKIRMQKPQSGGKFSVQIPGGGGGARGGMVMAKIYNSITGYGFTFFSQIDTLFFPFLEDFQIRVSDIWTDS